MRLLIRMLTIILGILAVLAVALYFYQDRIIFYPSRYPEVSLDESWRKIEYDTGEGRQVAFYRGPEKGVPEKLWWVFVGNASLALHWLPVAKEVTGKQPTYGFLLFDYPGYGESDGKPGRKSINRSVDTAIETLAEELQVSDPAELKAVSAFLGQSLGAAIAFETAARWNSPEVVAISPFTSIKAMANKAMRLGPVIAAFARHRWDSLERLEELATLPDPKVTIFHGDEDAIIPHWMGAEFVAAQPQFVEFQTVPGAGHNDMFMEIGDIIVDRLAEPTAANLAE